MQKLSNIVDNLQNRFFKSVVSNRLVYNTCWEDPRIDRQLLELNSNSHVVMLTSAGCNALDYLLDNPRKVHCIDLNPAQNAVLELKKALLANNNFQLLWQFFGEGRKHGAEVIYHRQVRPFLSSSAQTYWDQHINFFIPTSTHPSFYFRGTSGNIARLIYNRIQRKGLHSQIINMLNAKNLEEQTYYFENVEPQIWNGFLKWMAQKNATMTMLGVPETQQSMIRENYDSILDYVRQSLREVFTQRSLSNNYFWRVYLTGSYSRKCCPNYLSKNNFGKLNQRSKKIETHTSTLLQFLQNHTGPYSHFVLLDHQDWMAKSEPQTLYAEWQEILSNSQKGTKILFRSVSDSPDFLPGFVSDRVSFQPQVTKKLHRKDRVGTYESTHLGIVQ